MACATHVTPAEAPFILRIVLQFQVLNTYVIRTYHRHVLTQPCRTLDSPTINYTQGRRRGCATCAAAQGAIERGGAKTGGVKKI
jgi:hypothetical protein